MKTTSKKSRSKILRSASETTGTTQTEARKFPAFVVRVPVPLKVASDMKQSQTIFEKTINGHRFRVVQTVVVDSRSSPKPALGIAARWLADWPSIPPMAQPKRWVH